MVYVIQKLPVKKGAFLPAGSKGRSQGSGLVLNAFLGFLHPQLKNWWVTASEILTLHVSLQALLRGYPLKLGMSASPLGWLPMPRAVQWHKWRWFIGHVWEGGTQRWHRLCTTKSQDQTFPKARHKKWHHLSPSPCGIYRNFLPGHHLQPPTWTNVPQPSKVAKW